jgi:hypothetical protein
MNGHRQRGCQLTATWARSRQFRARLIQLSCEDTSCCPPAAIGQAGSYRATQLLTLGSLCPRHCATAVHHQGSKTFYHVFRRVA